MADAMRISIVICNYNYAAFIDAAIDSALAQTHASLEVIVVDDGSTDGSREVIARWEPRIVSVFKENGGQVSAYNVGLERATGEVVIFLDADDLLDAGACRQVAAAFVTGVVKVHFSLRLIDEQGAALGAVVPSQTNEGEVGRRLRSHGVLYQSSPGSGNAYRVSALRSLAPLPSHHADRHGADFFAIYGIVMLGNVARASSGPLGSYRVHRSSPREQLSFGNAAETLREPYRSYHRYSRMQVWLVERLGESSRLPPAAPDFSMEKIRYADAIFSSQGYLESIKSGVGLLGTRLLPAIVSRPGSVWARIGLAVWAAGVLVLPRKLGVHVARFVCNPASR